MKRADKAVRIARILDHLYPDQGTFLQHAGPFQLLVAVVLSAQTTDEQVNRVTPRLFRAAPTATELARLSVAEVLQIIRPCGLAPTKAKHLVKLAQQLVERHAAQVPRSLGELEQLPGVGHKSASVVMVQAFGEPAFPVDTHIHRLAARWGLSRARNVVETERDLKKLFPRDDWGRLHLQLIRFGREHCPARAHDFARCPVCSWAASKRRRAAEQVRWRPAVRS